MSNFKAHPITSRLVNRLREAVLNSETDVPYDELGRVAEMDVQVKPGYGYLVTARNRVQEDFGDVWKCNTGVGLFLVPHGDRARWGNTVTNKKINSAVRSGKKVMRTTDISKCTKEDINQFNSGAARLMLFEMVSKNAAQRRLLKATSSDKSEVDGLSVDKALKFLGLRKRTEAEERTDTGE